MSLHIKLVVVAVVLATGTSPAWAAATIDFAALNAAAIEWIRTTVTSTPFMVGTAIGVIISEGGRFAWRMLMNVWSIIAAILDIILRHRLVAVVLAGAIYWLAARFIFGWI